MTAHTALHALLLGALAFATPAAAEPVTLVPHRASYDLQIGPVKTSKSVAGAEGRIAFEFTGDACVGYAMNFRQVTRIDNGEGSKRLSDLRNTTWEDGKGEKFRFNIQTYTDGVLTQQSGGTAERGADHDIALLLSQPKATKLDLDAALIFPSQQMALLIEAARAGKGDYASKLYDGSESGEKIYDTLAIIGREVPAGSDSRLEEAAKTAGLDAVRRWPVTLSYFDASASQGERTPLYTLTFDLFENGVSGNLKLDFGEFALIGHMRSLELLKPAECVH